MSFQARLSRMMSWGLPALLAGPALGQYQIQQDGRLLDANPQYGNIYNTPRPISPLVGGNAFANGNMRGLSLQSYSPIGDPTALRMSLGSSSLSRFRRDSVSVGDLSFGSQLPWATPYFDPSRTAPTVGALRGQYTGRALRSNFGADLTPGPVEPTDARLQMRLDGAASVPLGDVRVRPPSATMSSLFGLNPPEVLSPTDLLTRDLERQRLYGTDSAYVNPMDLLPNTGTNAGQIPGARPPLGTPLDVAQRGGLDAPQTNPLGPIPREPRLTPGAAAPRTADGFEPKVRDPSTLPGYDVFTDMRLALELQQNPQAEWYQDMQKAMRSDPGLALQLGERAAAADGQYLQTLLDTPIRTLVGHGESEFNNLMLKAEAAMAAGSYREAADRYQNAVQMQPVNPLPWIGRANALIANGDFNGAILALKSALALGPEVARFKLDLVDLMGGGQRGLAVIDERRSQLMKLSTTSDFRRADLLFLLGYLEYFGGYPELGLVNLQKAASAAKLSGDAIIGRFPDLLQGRVLPPPELPRTPAPGKTDAPESNDTEVEGLKVPPPPPPDDSKGSK